jgi:hypothetical protein
MIKKFISDFLRSLTSYEYGSFLERRIEKYSKVAQKDFSRMNNSLYFRQIAEILLPNMVSSANPPEIEAIIPAAKKDFHLLELVTNSLFENCVNPIARITIVTSEKTELKFKDSRIREINELEFLPSEIINSLENNSAITRKGWTLQQVIKLYGSAVSEYQGVLVCDSDTILTKQSCWLLRNGQQRLSVSHEYHKPYQAQYERFMKSTGRVPMKTRLSYVTHHQLMQQKIVFEMLTDRDSGINSGIIEWLNAFDKADHSSGSEYHSYGTYLVCTHPEKALLTRWRNRGISTGTFLAERDGNKEFDSLELRRVYPWAHSVSVQSYL